MSDIDHLVPDPAFIKEFGVTLMTLWRWDRDPRMIALGLPPPIKIRKRNHRSRKQVEIFKANLLKRALAEREGAGA